MDVARILLFTILFCRHGSSDSCLNVIISSSSAGDYLSSALGFPRNFVRDRFGTLLIASPTALFRLDDDDVATRIGAIGVSGKSGDGGPVAMASFSSLSSMLLIDDGSILLSDGSQIRRIHNDSSTISLYAGTGAVFSNVFLSFGGDGGPALNATFASTGALVFDRSRKKIYVGDNRRVRSISDDGRLVLTIAGTGAPGIITNLGNGGPAISASFNSISSLALSPSEDTLYILDSTTRIRSLNLITGIIEHLAGTGVTGFSPAGSIAAVSAISTQSIVVRLNDGMVVFGENNMIRGISPLSKTIVNLYGTGLPEASGDGGPAVNCSFISISALAYLEGDLYIGGGLSTTVRVISSITGIISLVTSAKSPSETNSATSAPVFSSQNGVATAKNGDVYFTDTNSVYVYRPNEAVVRVAGGVLSCSNTSSSCGDNDLASSSFLNTPTGLAFTKNGDLIIGDSLGHKIRRVNMATGIITTIAGKGTSGFSGIGPVPALHAQLNTPNGVAVDLRDDSIFFVDSSNNRIRRIANNSLFTVAGNGSRIGFSYSGPALQVAIGTVIMIAVGPDGSIYFSETSFNTVRRIDPDHKNVSHFAFMPYVVNVDKRPGGYVAPTASGVGFYGDGGPATSATLFWPAGIAVDRNSNVYVCSFFDYTIRKISGVDGTVSTVVGSGLFGILGDGGPALQAQMKNVRALALDSFGNLFFSEFGSGKLREVAMGTTPNCPAGYQCPCGLVPIPCSNASFFCPAGTTTSQSEASPGFYSVGSMAIEKKSMIAYESQVPCPVGSYCSKGIAYLCNAGTFGRTIMQSRATSCKACPLGTYFGVRGATGKPPNPPPCLLCPTGSYANISASSFCKVCPFNSFSPLIGSMNGSSCQPCPAGSWAPFGASKCISFHENDLDTLFANGNVLNFQRTVHFESGNWSENELFTWYVNLCLSLFIVSCIPLLLAIGAKYIFPSSMKDFLFMFLFFLKRNDLFCDMSHPVIKGSVAVRKPTPIGGGFSIAAIGLMIAFSASLLLQYLFQNSSVAFTALPLSAFESVTISTYPSYTIQASNDLHSFVPKLSAGLSIYIQTAGSKCALPISSRESLFLGIFASESTFDPSTGSALHIFSCADCFTDDLSFLIVDFDNSCSTYVVTIASVGAWGTISAWSFVAANVSNSYVTAEIAIESSLDFIKGKDPDSTGYPTGGNSFRGLTVSSLRIGTQTPYGSNDPFAHITIALPTSPMFSRNTVTVILSVVQLFSSLIGNLGLLGMATVGFGYYLFVLDKSQTLREGKPLFVIFGKTYHEAKNKYGLKFFSDPETKTLSKTHRQTLSHTLHAEGVDDECNAENSSPITNPVFKLTSHPSFKSKVSTVFRKSQG